MPNNDDYLSRQLSAVNNATLVFKQLTYQPVTENKVMLIILIGKLCTKF